MNNYRAGCRTLEVLAFLLFVGGLYMVFMNRTPWFIDRWIDPLFWGAEPITPATARFKGFLYSYVGMMTSLWGVCIACIVRFGLVRRQPWAWNCLAGSAGLWFVLDTWFSLATGLIWNVVLNALFLAGFVIPLILTRTVMTPRAEAAVARDVI